MCFNHYIGVIIALFDPLFERIVYLTNSLVDEGRKNVVALVAANIYTTTTCLTTRDHLTIHPIEPIHLFSLGGDDSTPVRGALYEPTVLLGVSAEPRLSQRECFDGLNWAGRSLDGLPADLRDSGGPECRDFTNRTTMINTTTTTTSWPLRPRHPLSSREPRLFGLAGQRTILPAILLLSTL